MDEALIDNWNKVVGPEDNIYHLGDFSLARPDPYLFRLKGHISYIFGNHDKQMRRLAADGPLFDNLAFFGELAEITIEGQSIVLCHYAMRTWSRSHYGAWQLYGHSHNSLPDDPGARAIDVGVDARNYTPISFEEIKKIMEKKVFKPIDHHKAAV